MEKIGFGGSCHWCTEAIFQSLAGVKNVLQGWISSASPDDNFSEAVIVEFDPDSISLETLIEIHLLTHSCTANHSLRNKYRSAIYVYSEEQFERSMLALKNLQREFASLIITQVLPFVKFEQNKEEYLNYYLKNPDKPFCQNYITPKLKLLLAREKTSDYRINA